MTTLIILIVSFMILVSIGVCIKTILTWRTVVPTNEVHIIQSAKGTKAYGRGLDNGNVYYLFPIWIPRLGITVIELPTSIFDIELEAYDAYDKGRLPFTVDVKAFFKIQEAEEAAQRVEDFKELCNQLRDILKGSVRSILAGSDIETILSDRSQFGDKFTQEVADQLKSWGVNTVKNIEFMDIRDSSGSNVIANIMEKKKSEIEMESRQQVAENRKNAKVAEIDAERAASIREQDAEREVGERRAEKERKIGVANEQANQEIAEQAKVTKEKQMAIRLVEEEKQADIERVVAEIEAKKQKEVQIINADAKAKAAEKQKEQKSLEAEATLIQEQKKAEGVKASGDAEAAKIDAIGLANGNALKAKEMAPIQAQIALAKEIGENLGYQEYLLGVEKIKMELVVGTEKAKALTSSDLKVIANSGNVSEGFNSLMDLFSSKGGTQLGSLIEGFQNTDIGKELLNKFTSKK